MFDIGFSELLVIAVVALLVLGPERLPKAARFAGLWVRKARQQWYSVKSEFERDLAADELQRSLKETRESLRQAEEQLRSGVGSIRSQVEQGLTGAAALGAPDALPERDALSPPEGTAEADAAAPDGEPAAEATSADAASADPAPEDRHDDEHDRPLGSTLEMDALEPPPPADEDDEGEPTEPPPPHPDDAHAGR